MPEKFNLDQWKYYTQHIASYVLANGTNTLTL